MPKTCPRCGRAFLCQPDHPERCQCAGIVLSDAQRQFLRRLYPDCLCRSCLLELSQQ